jgi:oligopeptide transport system substrate-binding protein
MKKLNLFLASLLVLPAVFYFFARDRHNGQTILDKHLRVNLCEGDPTSLHPQRGSDIRARILGKSLFEGLTRIGTKKEADLAAAEKVEIDPSRRIYTFTLRPHRWSNGAPVTAYHFERAWKQAIHPDSLCGRSDLFYIIKNAKAAKMGELSLDQVGIHAKDEKTLVVELCHPAPYFLDLISHPLFSPLFNEEKEPTVFNGPFVIGKRQWGVVLELEHNPSYWDRANVSLQRVSISMITDIYTECAFFEKGELDVIGDCFDSLPFDMLPQAIKDPRFATQKISRVYWLYLNPSHPLFQSAKIRKAFSYGLDRNDLIENFLLGDVPCTTIVPNTLSLVGNDPFADGNLVKALELFEEGLRELGLTRETAPSITLSYCSYGSQKGLTQVLQERISRVFGIQVFAEGLDWNILSSNMVYGKYDIASCVRSALYEDPYYFLEIFKDKNSSYNFCRWENAEYKQILDLAAEATDLVEREKLLKKAEILLLEEMPVIPVYIDTCKYLTQKKLKGYNVNRSGYVDFKTMALLVE